MVFDGLLKSILKASSSIEDIFASEKMIELTTEMMDALEAELHPGSRDISGLVPLCPEACPTLEELVGDAVLAVTKADELTEHLAHIKDYIARFVTFVVTSDSVSKSKQVLEATVLPKFPVRNEKYWAMFYDAKSAGESSAQPGSRFPAYQKKTLKKEIRSAVGSWAGGSGRDLHCDDHGWLPFPGDTILKRLTECPWRCNDQAAPDLPGGL